jgi:hypothetical protein
MLLGNSSVENSENFRKCKISEFRVMEIQISCPYPLQILDINCQEKLKFLTLSFQDFRFSTKELFMTILIKTKIHVVCV